MSVAAGYRWVEHAADGPFGSALNPLRHLGSLGFLMLWLLAASGIVLYMLLDTSAQTAYESIAALSAEAGSAGSALRGLHRYAADGFVLLLVLHLAREWMLGRTSGFRRFSWLTGVPLLPLAFICAIGGFWLHWDQLGQYSAIATAEWFDALPFLSTPLTRNFLGVASVSDRLFSLFVFVHLGVPLLLVFGLWFHVQRISRAEVFPPRRLVLGTVGVLLLLALLLPVRSQGPADLASVPGPLAMDWLLLFVHPLTEATSPAIVWVAVLALLATLVALPYLPRGALPPVAQVHPPNCNGCRRCADDCPYAAITMVPHPLHRGRQMAEVRAASCASCGICVGACPSSTPFRSSERLVTGIDMPQQPIDALRRQLLHGLSAMRSERRLVVFGCDQGARTAALAAPDVLPLGMICTGMLPPSFVEYALRGGADGVVIATCREGGCAFRLGERWTAERLGGEREPHLRASVPRERLVVVAADAGDEAAVRRALDTLREECTAC